MNHIEYQFVMINTLYIDAVTELMSFSTLFCSKGILPKELDDFISDSCKYVEKTKHIVDSLQKNCCIMTTNDLVVENSTQLKKIEKCKENLSKYQDVFNLMCLAINPDEEIQNGRI